MFSFGQRLKATRKGAHLTQAELAEKLMVSVQAISKWERDLSMPDIAQIVPLSAILGVTTDYLLGVGGDEEADRKHLYEKITSIKQGIENVYSRNDNAFYDCYMLCKEHIRKYPLDYEIKLLCADNLVRYIYYGGASKEEKDKLYSQAIDLLKSVIRFDRDTTRIIDAKQTIIILYLYHNDFLNAKAVAEGLPQRGSIRASMEIEIFSRLNDNDRCIEIANDICIEAVHHYLRALAIKARRLSVCGNARKREAIEAWRVLIEQTKANYRLHRDIKIHTKWLYSALNHLANDYIAISEIDKAFDVMEELTQTLIHDYRVCKEEGNMDAAAEMKSNFRFYLHGCYNLCYPTDVNIITDDPRFKNCEQRLVRVGE